MDLFPKISLPFFDFRRMYLTKGFARWGLPRPIALLADSVLNMSLYPFFDLL